MAEIAIISFTNYPKGQTRPCMAAVMAYTKQDKKTLWQGQSLVSGINCRPESVYDDFLSTKLLYHKNDKTLFFHMVQSHPKEAEVDPVTAHAAAMEQAEYFAGREVLVCTHVDRDHVHSHFIINSVSLEDGRKLHIAEPQLQELRQRNDEICMRFGLPVFQKSLKKKIKSMSTAEYHTAAKGGSWKFWLMNTIDNCMKFAHTREEFITLMRSEGYDVRWEKSRQNITYTIPSGMKCRDDRLHDEKYLKEAMEREFGIRQRILAGRIETAEPAGDTTSTVGTPDAHTAARGTSDTGGVVRPADEAQCPVQRDNGASSHITGVETADGNYPDLGADNGTDAGCSGNTHNPRTGWEAERAALLAPPTQTQTAAPVPGAIVDSGDLAGLVGGVVELGYALERNQDTAPVIDATTKLPRHERGKKRKLASGQKADDHEDGQTVQQTMY